MLIKNCEYYDGKKFKKANIYVENGIISSIDLLEEKTKKKPISNKHADDEIFDAKDYYLIPGMINTHSHLPMTITRGIADNLTLQDWLFNVIFPVEGKFIDNDFIKFGSTLGLIEMIKSGITTSVEMYYLPEIMAETFKEIGFRGYIGIGSGDGTENGKQKAVNFIENYKNDELITPSPFAHAIYTTNENNLLWVKEISDKYNLAYQFHLLETKPENENFFKENNQNLMNYLEKIGFLTKNLIAAHSVWLTDEDIKILKRNDVTVSHNANSNLKLNSGIIRLHSLLKENVNVTLGTDGAASNNHISLLSEMNLAAKLHHIESGEPINVHTVFNLITKNPAKILNSKLGTIKEGNFADLVFIKKNHYSMLPSYNPISNLVYSMPTEAIDTVMINGKFVMKGKKLLTINEENFYKELNNYLSKINIMFFLERHSTSK